MTCSSCEGEVHPGDLFCEACGTPITTSRCEEDRGPVAAVTDVGLWRRSNQDAFALAGGVGLAAVVCDGVASTPAAALASTAASEAAIAALEAGLDEADREGVVAGAIHAAQAAVAQPEAQEGCTTIVAALVHPDRIVVGNVGDSRAYWIGNDGQLVLLSTDDTWAHEARAAGLPDDEVNRADRAHEITRWLGEDAGCVTPHLMTFRPPGPGLVVLCSDGLWNYAESAEAIAEVVNRARNGRPIALARHLVEYALGAGGADNVTVAVAEVEASGPLLSPE